MTYLVFVMFALLAHPPAVHSLGCPLFVPYGKIGNFCILLAYVGGNPDGAVGGIRVTAVQTSFTGISNLINPMINNSSIQKWHRLKQKDLDQQFIHKVIEGCGCSSFEAKAIQQTVYQVYAPFFENASSLKPGQILLPVVSVDAPPNKSLDKTSLITVKLTLFDANMDLEIRQNRGVVGLRQHRIQRVCVEAFQQGGLLTVEDLAHRLFNCGQRTICRDLKSLKGQEICPPLRSIVKDMGRTISHRKKIVQQWLLGDEYLLIGKKTFHSVDSVRNYVSKFKRVVVLTLQNYDVFTISFLVNISSSLVKEYQNLFQGLDIVEHRKQELDDLLKKTPFKKP